MWPNSVRRLAIGVLGVLAATAALLVLHVHNATTVALIYLLVTLFVASLGEVVAAIATSFIAALCFNFFFLPPVDTFTIADSQNLVALVSFLIVSVTASRLSTNARVRAREALDRRNEVTRLFDLSRDILLTTEREGARAVIARHVSRRFDLDVVAICGPLHEGGWQIHHGGPVAPAIATAELDRAFATVGAMEFDARTRAYGGHRELLSEAVAIVLTPVRIGARAIALLATGGRPLEPGTRDAVAGIVAIALERSQFLQDRRAAELASQRAQLASALLAALSHDLRTPLTAISTAVTNLDSSLLPEPERREQARVAVAELERLRRLFDEILDMARIDAGTVQARRSWTTPAEIVEAALSHAERPLLARDVRVDADEDHQVNVDPRLAASALSHVLENAARYSKTGAIFVRGWTDDEGLRLEVRDQGPGVEPQEIERLFEPFYRGEFFRRREPGTGMGLAITRGLVAADGGRVWAENLSPQGARFTIAIPAPARTLAIAE